MFKQIDYVMITVSDMGRSVKFYRDCLGIQLRFESPYWTEFETGTTILSLHGGGLPSSAKSEESKAGTCSIGFQVENINQTYDELKTKGVAFIIPPTDRQEEGIKLAVCVDPDGLPISIAERKK